ncbi:3'-5' exonuclease [Cohnella nanjingensis]|uniref:3'-5' exonuclease n=1 Tax=Cohnella nanjingensis TaxID=1387779 RepID=A0A7X0RLN8_9BACL|nr:3'-5' exonuclease [Cohnella nanjingensis]MBB6669636.1 3'-5' exonuclease [Cohnella nanjingensis]
MRLHNVTVFDFETSGLDPARDRVIEMAAIRCYEGEIVSQFTTLVRFDGILPPKITELTGLTSEQLALGMDEDTAFRILNRMIGDSILVAHNAMFDLGFLHHALQRLAGRSFSNDFIDTLTISRMRHTYPHTLKEMCARYGIANEHAHRALSDVYATWQLLGKLNEEESVEPALNVLGYLPKHGLPKWRPDQARMEKIEMKYA